MENNIDDMLSNDHRWKMCVFFLSLACYQMAYKLLLKQKTLKKITFFLLSTVLNDYCLSIIMDFI